MLSLVFASVVYFFTFEACGGNIAGIKSGPRAGSTRKGTSMFFNMAIKWPLKGPPYWPLALSFALSVRGLCGLPSLGLHRINCSHTIGPIIFVCLGTTRCPPIGEAGKTPRHSNSRKKAAKGGIFGRVANFDKCRSELARDVISGMAVA